MLKEVGNYVIDKATKTVVSKAVKWGFWSGVLFFGPGTIITVVGIEGLIAAGIIAHSGLIEYGTSKAIGKIL